MSGGKHCYPESDVLINKYNIRNKELLEKLEIQKVTVKLLGLDIHPGRIKATFDVNHLITIHKYLFGDLYEWAGTYREENLYKSERVLSGGSAEYAEYNEIPSKLTSLFAKMNTIEWEKTSDLTDIVSDFLLELWSIHPFREGNTRTCITFLWHYLNAKNSAFHVELIRNNPMYVRDSLVMANYEQKDYLNRIIKDALLSPTSITSLENINSKAQEQYQISKTDYEAFRKKYSVTKNK